jgi:hypothetical protein
MRPVSKGLQIELQAAAIKEKPAMAERILPLGYRLVFELL